MLETLRRPASTATLARTLNVSPSAVSQHMRVLHRCGLVDRTRSGREVLNQTSNLGLTLLGSPDNYRSRPMIIPVVAEL